MADSPRLPAVVLAAGFSRRMGRCKLTLPLDGEPLVRRVVRAALEAGLAPVFVTLRPDASPDLRAALSGFDDRVVLVPAPEAHRGQAESLKAGIRSVMASAPAYTRGGASTEYGSVTTRASAPDACGPENGTPPDPAQGHAAPVPPQPLPEGCLPASDGPTGSDAFPQSDGLPGPPGVIVLLGDQPLVSAKLVRELAAFFLEAPDCPAAPVCGGVRGHPVALPARAFGAALRLKGDEGARGLLRAFGLRLMPTNDTAAITDVDTREAYESLRKRPLHVSARKAPMPQSTDQHFITPPLSSGRHYENPALPPLPQLWSLDHREEAPIPDEAACRALWTRYAMFAHIERHSERVAEVAVALARRAVDIGATRHPELVKLALAAGLLHDIAKSYTVQYGGSHAQIGASWVIDSTGNHKVAQAVYHHVEWPWPLPDDLLHPVFLVIYADKRARHDEIVTLDERYEDLLVRYGKSEQSRIAIQRGWEHSKTIERVLSAQLEFPLHESTVVGGGLVPRA